jgi:hypothetical protein
MGQAVVYLYWPYSGALFILQSFFSNQDYIASNDRVISEL